MAPRFRSKLEADLAGGPLRGVAYEPLKLAYVMPAHSYCPDFVLPNGIIIEAKGVFTSRDRSKMLALISQHPALDIRFVFQTPYKTLNPRSFTTYAKWAETHGFKWCGHKDRATLAAWIAEPVNERALRAMQWRPE